MKLPCFRTHAYTLVEIMLVFAVLALLAAIAVPSYIRIRQSARESDLINEFRTTAEAFQMYSTDKGKLPPTSPGFQAVPAGMDLYMPKNSSWKTSPSTGGWWFWLNISPSKIWGFSAVIGLYNPSLTTEQLQDMDNRLDNGDLNTGSMIVVSPWVFFGVQ